MLNSDMYAVLSLIEMDWDSAKKVCSEMLLITELRRPPFECVPIHHVPTKTKPLHGADTHFPDLLQSWNRYPRF